MSMKKIEALILDRKVRAEIPTVPHFIKCGGEMVSIKEFTTEELRKIGSAWSENLVELK